MIRQKILFDNKECEDIINSIKTIEEKWNFKDNRSYISENIEYNKENKWIFDKLTEYFNSVLPETKITMINNPIHFHTYYQGDYFKKHNDSKYNRMYGIGVLLKDDFGGGNFVFTTKDKQSTIIDKVKGNTYIFEVKIDHEIEEITSGIRQSILWFITIENLYIRKNKLM